MSRIKERLIALNFIEFSVWGAYLISMGGYLAKIGLAEYIGWFYSVQGFVSLFMPALIGMIADRFVPAQRMLGVCHLLTAIFMTLTGYVGMTQGYDATFAHLFVPYALGTAFFMPTLALSNSVSYAMLERAGEDAVKVFPSIRIFGTIGFISSMWMVDLWGFQHDSRQFFVSAVWSVMIGCYTFTLPSCAVSGDRKRRSASEAFGLHAFTLFRERRMAVFFLFSMLLGVSLQITNGYANTFVSAFAQIPAYADTFVVRHANILISLSQISETLCILLIPFCLQRWGIKKVIFIAMMAWALRFGLFAVGNPGSGVWCLVLSMIVYGIAFDFFNISGSLFVNQSTDAHMRSGAQGLFMMMTNGFGATIGTLGAQAVVNTFVYSHSDIVSRMEGWQTVWTIFACYALVVGILFALFFKVKNTMIK